MPTLLERRGCVAALVSLALVGVSAPIHAAPALADSPVVEGPQPAESSEPEPSEPESSEPEPSEPEPTEQPDVEVGEVERTDVPAGGGVAGAIVDPNDPNAGRAQSDLEGESLDRELDGLPERMPKLQAAGWWTTFTAVALATTGGIFAGVAEVREDEAERLAYSFDLETGASTLYGPVESEYERLLREGNTYQWVARGFIIAGGATLIASVALFVLDAKQRKKPASSGPARVRLDPGPSGLSLRF